MQNPTKHTLLTIALVPGILVTVWVTLAVLGLGAVGVAEAKGITEKVLNFLQIAGVAAVLIGICIVLPIKLSTVWKNDPQSRNWLWILSLLLAYLPALAIVAAVVIGMSQSI
jgi:malic enzyme